MLTILDVRNTWSRAADDADRYLAEKIEFTQGRPDLRHIVIQPDTGDWTERRGHTLIEHVGGLGHELGQELTRLGVGRLGSRVAGLGRSRAGLVPGRRLRELVQLHRPDVIECGSPVLLPALVQVAAARLSPRPALIGHWHGDLAHAVRPRVAQVDARLANVAEQTTDWVTRTGYAGFDAVFVPSPAEAQQLRLGGVERLYLTPLGVDADRFTPAAREPGRLAQLRAGVDARAIFWIDAEVERVAPIYAALCQRSSHDPALILARDDPRSQRFARARAHVQVAPSVADDPDARASLLAAADVAVALGGAVACAEAMACARPLLAAADVASGVAGARAAELVRASGCGRTVGGRARAEAIADAVLRLSAEPPAEREAAGQRGRVWIHRFDWPSCFERILAAYVEVLEHLRAGRRVPLGVHARRMPPALTGSMGSPG